MRPLFEPEASVSEIGELGARRFYRGAQGTPLHTIGVRRGKPSGPPFFWFVFFGGAKKMNSPEGAKPTYQKELTLRPKEQNKKR